MDFRYSPEQETFRAELRAWLDENLPNHFAPGELDEEQDPDARFEKLLAWHRAMHAGKWVGICGEMASDPICSLVLLGMGLDDLSMGSFFVPVIKRIVRSVSTTEVRALARDLPSLSTVKEVKGHLFDGMKSLGIIELMEMYH